MKSADKAFRLIAFQRKLVTEDALATEERAFEARARAGDAPSFADHLIERGLISAAQKADVERLRARHGRACRACKATTFLLPGESQSKKPCEHCGGALIPAEPPAKPAATPPKPAAPPPKPAAPVAPKPPRTTDLRSLAAAAADAAPAPFGSDIKKPRSETKPLILKGRAPDPDSEPPRAPSRRLAPVPEPEPPAPVVAAPPREPPPVASRPLILKGRAPTGEPQPAPAEEPAAPPPPPRLPPPKVTFGPPPEQAPAPPAVFVAAPPAHSFTSELGAIFSYPVRGAGGVVVLGAALMGVVFTFVNLCGLALLAYVLSLVAYQAKVIQSVVAGEDSPPTRPALGETLTLIWPPFATGLTCFLPVIVFGALTARSPRDVSPADVTTVGPFAHLARRAAPRLGANLADVELVDVTRGSTSVRVGDRRGRWLVLGFVNAWLDAKDFEEGPAVLRQLEDDEEGDDEVYDLGRLSAAARDVDVVALHLDPGSRFAGGKVEPFPNLRQWAARSYTLPGALEDCLVIPTVWIVDPSGKVRKEFVGGASDEVIWGTLRDLRKGGRGEATPEPLPGRGGGLALGTALVSFALSLLGWVYYPMAILMVLFGNPLLAFNYPVGFRAIRATLGEYALVLGVTLLVFVVSYALVLGVLVATLGALIVSGSTAGFALGEFVILCIVVYGTLVQSYAVGRFYVRNEGSFEWARRA